MKNMLKKNLFLFALNLLLGCSAEPESDEEHTIYSVSFVDVSLGRVKDESIHVSVLSDSSYSVVYIRNTVSACDPARGGCICYKDACATGELEKVRSGALTAEEIAKFEEMLTKKPASSSNGNTCRYYNVSIDKYNDPWEVKVCTDDDPDTLDLDVQKVINELVARAK